MSPYRKRFVQFNMLLIGLVLTVMVCLVAVYMYRDYYFGLKTTRTASRLRVRSA